MACGGATKGNEGAAARGNGINNLGCVFKGASWLCGPPKAMKTPDAGARFGLSWWCAVAGRGVFAVSSPCL
jgi:hypothetical protein